MIDHALSFRFTELQKLLSEKPQLIERVEYMLKYHQKKKPIPGVTVEAVKQSVRYEEYDDMQIIDPNQVSPKKDCLALSLYSNLISDLTQMTAYLQHLPELKVLWLNENPISNPLETLRDTIEKEFPQIEMLNSNFTKNASGWAFKFITFNQSIPKAE